MSFGGTGMRDWLIQRFSAVILSLYTVACLWFLLSHREITFASWYAFFMHPAMKIATLLALVSLSLHAWIGLWTVLTDYVHQISVRYFLQTIIIVALFAYFFWGFQILYYF